MSHSKRKADLDSSEVAAPKRQAHRSFHAGPNPVAHANDGQEHKDEAEPAEPADVAAPASASAAAPSPRRQVDVSLRCIFAWLDLADLHRTLSVSTQWHANVCAMPPIGARVIADEGLRSLAAVCASSLARHVSSLTAGMIVSAADLAQVTARMPALRELQFKLAMSTVDAGATPLVFPQRLTKLDLTLSWQGTSEETSWFSLFQALLERVGALKQLEELTLEARLFIDEYEDPEVSFEPLRALHGLRSFTFRWGDEKEDDSYVLDIQTLTSAQLGCLRYLANSHALRRLHLFAGRIDRLLMDMAEREDTAPLLVHDLDATKMAVTSKHVHALSCFPELRVFTPLDWLDVQLLPSMTNLHTLQLFMHPAVTAEQLVSAVQPLTQLTDLTIDSLDLNVKHLTRLLAPLPLLLTLRLDRLEQLRSLSFLASGHTPVSLTSLTLNHCDHMSTSNLMHLHACSRLTRLELSWSFYNVLGAFGEAFYKQRPCLALPALQEFIYNETVFED